MTVKKNNLRRRTFSTKKVEGLEPIVVEIDDKEFHAHPRLPGAVLLEFMQASTEDGASIAAGMFDFLKNAFPEDEYTKLNETLHDADNVVDEEMIGDIVAYLIEEYTASRPTEASE